MSASDDDGRWRRPEPVRTEPIRDWTALPRSGAFGGLFGDLGARPDGATSQAAQRATLGGVVSEGVALGYRVIEEQIQQGRRAAERMSQQAYGPAAMSSDYGEAAQRMLRFYAEAGQLWLQLMMTFMGGMGAPGRLFGTNGFPPTSGAAGSNGQADRQAAAQGAASAYAPAGPAPPTEPTRATGSGIAIEVASSRPVRTLLDLRPGAEHLHLAVAELRSIDRESKPLSGVVFEPGPPGEPPTLRIHVPDQQAVDVYHGVVVDRQTGQPVGTLSIHVRP
jgi:hypothetical protein